MFWEQFVEEQGDVALRSRRLAWPSGDVRELRVMAAPSKDPSGLFVKLLNGLGTCCIPGLQLGSWDASHY